MDKMNGNGFSSRCLLLAAAGWSAACILAAGCSTKFSENEDAVDDGEEDGAPDDDTAEPPDEADLPADPDGEEAATCGNGVVDSGEECDDGNDVPGDGCEPSTCRFSCREDAECLDEDICNGEESCSSSTHACGEGTVRPPDGAVCRDGTPRRICLGGTCVFSACGDGFVDEGNGESCDPPGEEGCPGNCRWGCEVNEDCTDDGDMCNGEEFCDLGLHACGHRFQPPDGTVCRTLPRLICLAEVCGESLCGDGFVDTGGGESCEPPGVGACSPGCRWACETETDCPDDGNICNGTEFCDTALHLCASRDPLDDGASCGASPRMMCLGRTCQQSICGDGFTDALLDPPEECDDGNGVAGDGCEPDTCLYSCHGDGECDDGRGCSIDACDLAAHVCQHEPAGAGVVCRPVAGDCDVEEACDGTDLDCPDDAFLASDVVCHGAAGPCDEAELCTGTLPSCPVDGFLPPGTPCDDGDDLCTHPDACDGAGTCVGGTPGLLHRVVTVTAGRFHTCALLDTGDAYCWGRNYYGMLGDGTTTDRSAPVRVAGLPTGGVVKLDAGQDHTCAFLGTAGVLCWGNNSYSQIGDGTAVVQRTVPTAVVDLPSTVAFFDAGYRHNCVILEDGSGLCWGNNDFYQLGDGTTGESNRPVAVTATSETLVAIDGGSRHTCAITDAGAAICWGRNLEGQLGDGTTSTSAAAVGVLGLSSGVADIEVEYMSTCAILSGGSVMCWGSNSLGDLGDGTLTTRLTPVSTLGLSSPVLALGCVWRTTCASLSAGGVMCWGYNNEGQVGDGTTTDRSSAVPVLGLPAEVAPSVDAGQQHACAVESGGRVLCWGDNGYGQLGDGTGTDSLSPVSVVCPP